MWLANRLFPSVQRLQARLAAIEAENRSLNLPFLHSVDRALNSGFGQIPAAAPFANRPYFQGMCCVCGQATPFFAEFGVWYRETLNCGVCLTTSRYRALAKGILRAIHDLTGLEVASLADLSEHSSARRLSVYDTQRPFYWDKIAYPIPDLLTRDWIDVRTSQFADCRAIDYQDLEHLSFPDGAFDIVITSDVMEHVRLPNRAHAEIRRVLKLGGIYVFTVPTGGDHPETLEYIEVPDPADPSRDRILVEEYHLDGNDPRGRILAYRQYGTGLADQLRAFGFDVDLSYFRSPSEGLFEAEMYYCRAI